jgi:hypothetical protein
MPPSSDEYISERELEADDSVIWRRCGCTGRERLLSGTQLGLNRWCRERSGRRKDSGYIDCRKKAKSEEVGEL